MQYHSQQRQSKRQREWVYLCHYLAITGLDPVHIISGEDDGHEPDFTLIFWQNEQLRYIGIELTTLPRLRDQMGEVGLIAKRWYWQSLRVLARINANTTNKIDSQYKREYDEQSLYLQIDTEGLYQYGFENFRLPISTWYMPDYQFSEYRHHFSEISQADMDAVLQKKAHKVDAYQRRRTLDELWLLVHTDKYQSNGILVAAKKPLLHDSGFQKIHITRYPSHKIIDVQSVNG
ncbi:hypothetical protein [Psychrobacter sp. I-STPA6b]|uniref:hypothetical protein n=1 Tax=Psychrobacter sp. I-STPA6b TaxID=2585718 RepID=UPI001D0C0D68|nr:hypothetical protein [Psychrobacter sp. I-STPA6b]